MANPRYNEARTIFNLKWGTRGSYPADVAPADRPGDPMLKTILAVAAAIAVAMGTASAQTCSGMPYTLTNGQAADASQVMADFNYVLNCATSGPASAPVGAERGLVVQSTSTTTLTLGASEVIVETAIGGTPYRLSNLSLTLNIAGVGAGGMDIGSAAANADLSVYLIYDPATGTSALLGTLGSTSNGPVYAGSHMPSGYTASALVSSLRANASAQLGNFVQVGRMVEIAEQTILNGGSANTLTELSLSAVVPANAQTASGTFGSVYSGSGLTCYLASNSSGAGEISAGSGGTTVTTLAPFKDLILGTPQTIYYTTNGNGSEGVAYISISGYRF